MITIDFIRHCESDTSIHDDAERPLTQVGERQAARLAQCLRGNRYDAVYASPLRRAVETVMPLAAVRGMAVQESDALVERIMPGWIDDYEHYVERQWHDLAFSLAGGESIRQVQQRYMGFIAQLPQAQTYIAVGSHGTAMSGLVECANPGGGYQFFSELRYGDVLRVMMHDGIIDSCSRYSTSATGEAVMPRFATGEGARRGDGDAC